VCYLASELMGLAIFIFFLCSSAECFSPDAAESRRRRQRSKHRSKHNDQVNATRRTGSVAVGSGLGTTIKYLRRTRNGTASNGLGTTNKHLCQTAFGGNRLAATTKYLRGAAEIGLGTTIKYLSQCSCVLKIIFLHLKKTDQHHVSRPSLLVTAGYTLAISNTISSAIGNGWVLRSFARRMMRKKQTSIT